MKRRTRPGPSILAAAILASSCATGRPVPAVDEAIAGPEWARGAVFY